MSAEFCVIRRSESGYPRLLSELHDPPHRLHIRGDADALCETCVAVVGARSCSSYGAQAARSLARELARSGVAVVSGLARGVDGQAHRGALEGGGKTIAILGCGIDRNYPQAHSSLADQIEQAGAIVSEWGPGVEPAPWRFPARNRIIAGLARSTVVVEARSRSGALITADFALELGRDVFAVPGEITSGLSAGTNDLLRQGAAPALSAADVLGAVGIDLPPNQADTASLSELAREVLRRLGDEPLVADELVRLTGRHSGDLSSALVELELAGRITESAGVYRVLL